jgi:lysophospholipase L1-like esterase
VAEVDGVGSGLLRPTPSLANDGTVVPCVFTYPAFKGLGKHRVRVGAVNGSTLVAEGSGTITLKDWLIVGLGDSNGSGEGNPDVPGVASPLWEDFRCHRSARSYQALAALAVEAADDASSVTFVHLACSGASITQGLTGPYVGLNDPGGLPLASQVAAMRNLAGRRPIDAVLVSIGVNDLGFSPLVAFCIQHDPCWAERGFDPAAPEKSLAQVIRERLAALPGRYAALAQRFTELGVPASKVFITQYFDSTRDGKGNFCDPLIDTSPLSGVFTQVEAGWAFHNVLVPLNAAVAKAAKQSGWQLVSGAQALFRTHGYCSSAPWIVQLTESLAAQGLLWNGPAAAKAGTLHANQPGHAVQARLIVAALKAAGIPR